MLPLDLDRLIGYIGLTLIIFFFWNINSRTRKLIDQWALNNEMTVLSKLYIPWHWYFAFCGGFHPANFRVTVFNSKNEKETYWITGGGLFWLSNDIKVRKVGNV